MLTESKTQAGQLVMVRFHAQGILERLRMALRILVDGSIGHSVPTPPSTGLIPLWMVPKQSYEAAREFWQ